MAPKLCVAEPPLLVRLTLIVLARDRPSQESRPWRAAPAAPTVNALAVGQNFAVRMVVFEDQARLTLEPEASRWSQTEVGGVRTRRPSDTNCRRW